MGAELISRDKRRRCNDVFEREALMLLAGEQHQLLRDWLKNPASSRTWTALLKCAGTARIEMAESLRETLLACGAVELEERFSHAQWIPVRLTWCNYELICGVLGIATRSTRQAGFDREWSAATGQDWQTAALSDAYQELQETAPDSGSVRLSLLSSLNAWLKEGRSGTRRDFSLFARGQSKQIKPNEWAWMAGIVDLDACGIARHAPALWLAGDAQLKFGERWLDLGATGDCMGLTASALCRLTEINTSATHYRLIENRTSFERVARLLNTGRGELVIWLPGYAPNWWRTAISQLLALWPAPSRISCDADPDGVQIALQASDLWTARGLDWEPCAMSAEDIAASAHQLALSQRDISLAEKLLQDQRLPAGLQGLMNWCIRHRCKAEQENWL